MAAKGESVNKENIPAKNAAKNTAQGKASVYSAKQLIAQHSVFNASKEIVEIALKKSGKDCFTVAEAEKIIKEFKNKEVN